MRKAIIVLALLTACRELPTQARACPAITVDSLPDTLQHTGVWVITIIPPQSKTCQLLTKKP